VTPEPPVQRQSAPQTAFTAPAISGWIADSAVRHGITLVTATLVIAVCDLLGAEIDWRAYVVMGGWIGMNLWMSPWSARPSDYDSRLRRYAITLLIDVVFLGAAYFFLDAPQIIGAVFFAHMALTAASTLPRRWAVGIAALIVTVYGTVVVLGVAGVSGVASPAGLPPVAGNWLFAVAAIASAIGMVVLLMHLQSRLIKSIRDAERRYVTLVQSAPDMVMTFDAEGKFLDANPATLEQSGYSWADLKALPTMGFFMPTEWPLVVAAFRRTLAGETQRLKVRYVRKGGSERWVEGASSLLTIDEKPAVVLIARDVTEQHFQAEALQLKDARLNLVLRSMRAGFMAFDGEGRVTAVYGEWARRREAAGDHLVGRRVEELTRSPEALARHLEVADKVRSGDPAAVPWTLRTPNGDRQMRTHLVPVRDERGAIVGGAGLWVDETELARAEREREQLRKRVADADRVESLGKLVSGVAHELNNPLAAILNFTEDLLADARTPDERLALEVIQSQALRSRTIVRDLLTYVRRDIARPKALSAPAPILETLARAMRPGFATQGVTFSVELAGDPVETMLDRTGFEQVVTNLLTNAAHAAGAGGSICLSSRVRGETYEVIVEDNGAGISADLAEKIFEPFFTTKPTGQGVGLGLSVSLGIVHAHGGTLKAENRPASSGGGARFILSIPIKVTTSGDKHRAVSPSGTPAVADGGARAPIVEAASKPRALPERRPTILIIDDEGAIRQGLRRYFTRKGWAVEESPDGADALSKLLRPEATRIYDVVLCDLKMAGVSGMDVYERVLATNTAIANRFILSTGDTSAPDVSGFLSQVTVPILEKPFELTVVEQLAESVRTENGSGAAAAARGPA
jgi:PAS domain S-box-containing protein